MTTKPPLQKILQGILHTENESNFRNETMRGQATPNHRRRKDKESESNTDSATQIKPLNNKKIK
jgi:hypothetical protein